jgi:hypothetical protein
MLQGKTLEQIISRWNAMRDEHAKVRFLCILSLCFFTQTFPLLNAAPGFR